MDGKRLFMRFILFWKKCKNDSQRSAELLMTGAGGLVSLLSTEHSVVRPEGALVMRIEY